MLEHIPALVVLVPLFAGLLVALVGQRERAWWLTTAASWVLLGLCLQLAHMVQTDGVISYYLGGWGPQHVEGVGPVEVGIQYRVDELNAFVLLLIAVIGAVVTPFARLSVKREIPADRRQFFYATYLFCLAGLLGITISGDAFNVYVLLEISSLATYALVAMGKSQDRRALTASFHYLLLGTVGASFLLIGIGYLFMVTGTLNMAEMAVALRDVDPGNRTVITAFALILVGLGLKAALFPLHAWLPNAYTYAPSAVTALLASTATKVGVYVAIRFFYTIFGGDALRPLEEAAREVLLVLACMAIVHGSLMAIQQTNVKRLLAYSSVAQIGYMILGACLANEEGLTGTLLHMFNHALVKGALFIAVAAIVYRTGSSHLDELRGLGRKMPLTTAAIVVAGLGLVGVPLTGGFVSKWLIVSGALAKGRWIAAVVVLFGSLLAVVYLLRILEPLLFGKPEESQTVGEAPPSLTLPAWVLAAGTIYCGVVPGPLQELARAAARSLIRGAGA